MVAIKPAPGVIPQSLRASQLKRLAFLCGLPVSGRKEELITRLTNTITATTTTTTNSASLPPEPRPGPPHGPVVLSIDLGIRNLAFSLLSPIPPAAPPKRKTKVKKRGDADQSPSFSGTSPPAVKLHAWRRLSLLEGPARLPTGSGGKEALGVDASSTAFSPATLAKTANAFLQETVFRLEPPPTHILIERQRWRSGGGAAIQEWTVRVNTLEAMLHASLRTLHNVGAWKGEVMSIRPERVGQLFVGAEGTDTKGAAQTHEPEGDEADMPGDEPRKKRVGGRKTSAEAKKLKIELLSGWLDQGAHIVEANNVEVKQMLDAYSRAVKGTKHSKSKRGARKGEEEGSLLVLDKKLDDLTDCLLQGMAWLRWEENIAMLRREGGVEQLLDEDA
ncbi:putative cruciform cutting endonuclease mitochondrial protein [Rosellinia necatrix]|uniref:Putative cruciform cutting endonuclease mitochondrial protein n=1 Tax=Rosellinia necatrix TaxID=77044 RepID=A0A1S7UKC9_ROSNE|nr:putative cruciform cutting endonuclease mitochondrial protein [Rosellinia necatrix]